MRAVFDGEGHLITTEQTRLGKLFAHDYFGELGVLVQEWPGIPFRRRRSARIVSKVALLGVFTYQDLQNLCQSSYQIHNRVQCGQRGKHIRRSEPPWKGDPARKGERESFVAGVRQRGKAS